MHKMWIIFSTRENNFFEFVNLYNIPSKKLNKILYFKILIWKKKILFLLKI